MANYVRGKQWERGDDQLLALGKQWERGDDQLLALAS